MRKSWRKMANHSEPTKTWPTGGALEADRVRLKGVHTLGGGHGLRDESEEPAYLVDTRSD